MQLRVVATISTLLAVACAPPVSAQSASTWEITAIHLGMSPSEAVGMAQSNIAGAKVNDVTGSLTFGTYTDHERTFGAEVIANDFIRLLAVSSG